MNNEKSHWGQHELSKFKDSDLPLRNFISTELPETRLFIDQLYREFRNTGPHMDIDKLLRRRDDLPWVITILEKED